MRILSGILLTLTLIITVTGIIAVLNVFASHGEIITFHPYTVALGFLAVPLRLYKGLTSSFYLDRIFKITKYYG